MRIVTFRVLQLLLLAVLGLFACAPPAPPPQPPPVATAAPPPAQPVALQIEETPVPDPSISVPVTPNEASWGDPLAPVTWVIWGDYECPFTAKLFLRLDSFMSVYGPKQLRLVWRHNPLPFHKNARPLATVAETALRLGGPRVFWYLSQQLFANQEQVEPKVVAGWLAEAGMDMQAFADALEAHTYAAKVDEDMEVGKAVGIAGTPASLINGRFLSGAQPNEKFVAVIDEELAAARQMIAAGVPRNRVYAEAVAKNYKKPEPPKPEPQDTTTVWKVALGSSPVRGKATAQVTMVMFSDFQCPFCGKAQATIKALEQEYGDKLRFVFKHNPLPFHPRAEPAAQLAIEARAQGGDARFWEAHDLLFGDQQKLSDADLEDHARTLKLEWKRAAAALAAHKHAAVIEADMIAADDLGAHGTPTFYINGRRITGSQSITLFKTVIDEEIRKADALLAAGTSAKKLYETLQKDGREPPPPERILVPAPTAANPVKGAKAGANVVTVQMFGDFQCRYCKRAEATMDELIAAFPGKVRVVWRQRPLAVHQQAQLAAEASIEARAQKGDAGFWAFAKLLWEDQAGLDKEGLIKKAAAAGLDAAKMRAALDAGTHQAAVKAEVTLAESLKIMGTPSFAVGDYYIGGAESLLHFKRAVQRALGPRVPPAPESLHGAKKEPDAAAGAAPAAPAAAAAQGPVFGARHLLVMYKGSNRAPAHVTRTRAEALARAQEARKKALAGAKFEDLVSEYSDEPGAAQRGGDLGTFPRGRMVEAFQEGVENTAVGKISVIVETPFGFHVILRTK